MTIIDRAPAAFEGIVGQTGASTWGEDMKRLIALGISLGLVAALTVPVVAAGGHDKATGTVYWDAQYGANPGLTTHFDVHDDPRGKVSSYGDRGTLTHYHPTKGSFVMNVECAKVNEGWAEFAGVVTAETGDGYTVGKVYLWSVLDGGTPGSDGDSIGGTGRTYLADACAEALDDKQFDRKSIITGGNLVVHNRAD